MENSAALSSGLGDRETVIAHWADSIRTACNALRRMPYPGMTSIEVRGRLDGSDTEARLLRALSGELAERYGFRASVELGEDRFAVRFSR